MKNLEEYLRENIENGIINHNLKASVNHRGEIEFYIKAESDGSETLDFRAYGNKLLSKVSC